MLDLNYAQIFFSFIVLLFSLTVHEMAHAWTADRLGDPTARLLGRVSLNPLVHADLVGTVVFPLLALIGAGGGLLIGWAKPVPVSIGRLRQPRRDFMLVALAGPISNLLLAFAAALALRLVAAGPARAGDLALTAPLGSLALRAVYMNVALALFNLMPIPPLDGGNVLSGLLPYRLAAQFERIRPYGFLVLYALILSGKLSFLIGPPSYFLLSWLL